jgi:hypothetical protein
MQGCVPKPRTDDLQQMPVKARESGSILVESLKARASTERSS